MGRITTGGRVKNIFERQLFLIFFIKNVVKSTILFYSKNFEKIKFFIFCKKILIFITISYHF
jgi:hypothetical protein